MSAAAMRLHQFAAAAAGMLPFTGRYHSDVCARDRQAEGLRPIRFVLGSGSIEVLHTTVDLLRLPPGR
jgi:hypothetical protein